MKRSDPNSMIPILLDSFREIAEDYERQSSAWVETQSLLSPSDLAEISDISRMHRLPSRSQGLPITQFLESIYVPKIVSYAEDGEKNEKVVKDALMEIERFASSDVFDYRNAVACSFCEPLLTKYETSLTYLVKFMGNNTKSLFIMQLDEYHISESTKRLFL